MEECGFTPFFFFLLHFLKLYNRNDGVTGKFFTLYEMVKVKMLRSSMQVKYPANRNMSETSASYQADDATEAREQNRFYLPDLFHM